MAEITMQNLRELREPDLQKVYALERENADLRLQLERGVKLGEVKPNHFGYGILDKNGQSAWSEMCVCEDADPLHEEIERLTDWYPDLAPYRVVELQWVEVQP